MLDHVFHRFGPFLIIRTLGRGGMGEVFIARTPWDDNPLAAVKRLRPDVARVPTFSERFQHEAELAVRLDHQNVVGTLDVGSVEGQLYVASELILGKDTGLIADRLRERGQGGPAAVAIRLLLDALSGLAYVHGAREDGKPLKLVHRDVTPGNLLVGYDGIARLADFGLAKSLLTERSNLTNHGEILGTPHYLAPEVIRGEMASPAADLYGVGSVMYRFLTGVAPHQGTTAEVLLKVLSEEPRPLSDLRPDLPAWVVSFVHRLLEKDPEQRPFDAAALLRQLNNEAREDNLLVPRASVGRWLGNLFETERIEEMEERDRIADIQPDAIPEKPEGTVVLARPRTGSRLEAPLPVAGGDESQGTELDLSENEVKAAVAEIEDRPIVKGELDSSPPSDVTEAALITSFSFEFDEEGMPTRAVSILPRIVGRPPPHKQLDEDDDDATGNEPIPEVEPHSEKTKFGSFLDSDPDALPGFVDDEPKKEERASSFTPSETSPDPAGSVPPRKQKPKSVPPQKMKPWVGPDPTDPPVPTEDPTRSPKSEPPRARSPERSEPPRRQPTSEPPRRQPTSEPPRRQPTSDPPHNRTQTRKERATDRSEPPRIAGSDPRRAAERSEPPRKITGSDPRSAAERSEPPRSRGTTQKKSKDRTRPPKKRSPDVGRNILMLAGLLGIAIALGVGIGVVVASVKNAPTSVVHSPEHTALKKRYLQIQLEMNARRERGAHVPQRAWELSSQAGQAIIDGDVKLATRAIDELESVIQQSEELSPMGRRP